MGKLRLLIIDGNELTRALLRYVLRESSVVEIVGEAVNYQSSVGIIKALTPDAVVIGEDMQPGALDLRSIIRSDFPDVRVIELSALDKAVLKKMTVTPEHFGGSAFDAAFISFSEGAS